MTDAVKENPTGTTVTAPEAPATILIVDDELESRKLLELMLRADGYRTLTAVDGHAALNLISEQKPDLILLDILMPGMDGLEVARILKANPATTNIPIILLTVQVDSRMRLAGLSAGAEEFLTKPLDRSELSLRVRKVLRLRAAGDFLEHEKELVEQRDERLVRALRESELSYRRLFQTARDGILILDAVTGRVDDVNPFLLTLLGYSFDEMLGKTVGELSPFKDIGSNQLRLELLQKDGYVRYDDLPLEARDGRQIAVEFVSNVYQAGDRKVIQCNIRDISERKRVAMELRGSERRFSDLLQNVELASVILDAQGRITFCNEYVLRLTGWRLDEVVGRDYFESFVPAEYGDAKAFSARLPNMPEAWVRENEITLRSGERRRMRWNSSLLRSGAGDVIGAASIGEDITEQRQASALLAESRYRLALATESARIGIWDWNVVADKMLWDPQMYALYGIRAQDFTGAVDAWHKGLHPDSRGRAEAEIVAALDGSKDFHTEFRVVWPNNEVRDIEAHAVVKRDEHGTAIRMTGVNWDITARKQAASRVIHLNRVYAVLSGINALIVRASDRNELFSGACRIAVEDGGFHMSMICTLDRPTMTLFPVASWGKDEELLTAIKSVLASPEEASRTMLALAVKEKKVLISNNSQSDPRLVFGEKYSARAVRSIAVLPLIVADEVIGIISLYAREIEFFHAQEMKLLTELASDIAFAIDYIAKAERLEYLAYYDVLTGLANRSLFLDRLVQLMRSASTAGHKLAVALIDLERFKSINDSLGQPGGDALLKQVAEWLTHTAGDASLLARVEADHFAIVLPKVIDEGNVVRMLEKGRQAFMDHPFVLNNEPFRIAFKSGVALFPDDGTDADTLFKHAEAALKRAKAAGEPYLFYTQKMSAAAAGRLSLENQLRRALDQGEFVLHYQPKVNFATGRLTGAEALIRWNDPATGLVPPAQFIPLLEETGLIHEVGRWTMRQAVEDYRRWRAMGFAAPRIAVNVSPLQLRHRNFIAEVRELGGIDAHVAAGLELELTETLIMEDVKHSIASLQAVRDMGINIAIDDFGTGFSSLSYLSKLPVDSLKIDRSFVINMTAGPGGLALVSTIIMLAHALKLKVVAEGVETQEQSQLLRLLRCDEMQGYLFSKPLPIEVFETRYLAPQPSG